MLVGSSCRYCFFVFFNSMRLRLTMGFFRILFLENFNMLKLFIAHEFDKHSFFVTISSLSAEILLLLVA